MFVTITRTIGDTARDPMVINKNKLIGLIATPCFGGFNRDKIDSIFIRFKMDEGNSFELSIQEEEMIKHLKEGKKLDIDKTAANICHDIRSLLNSDACGAIALDDSWLSMVVAGAE